MSRHAREKNPEIRPSCELPLFEQSFYKFEQQHSALPEIEKVPKEALAGAELQVGIESATGPRSRRIAAQSHGEQKSCLTAPLSAHGESGDCLSGAQTACSPRDVARARRSDPHTSFQAAASVTNLGRVRDGILEILREHGPQIDEDLIVIYHNREKTRGYKLATDQSIRSRRKELERDFGKLVCCGTKKNKRKRMSQIWRLK